MRKRSSGEAVEREARSSEDNSLVARHVHTTERGVGAALALTQQVVLFLSSVGKVS